MPIYSLDQAHHLKSTILSNISTQKWQDLFNVFYQKLDGRYQHQYGRYICFRLICFRLISFFYILDVLVNSVFPINSVNRLHPKKYPSVLNSIHRIIGNKCPFLIHILHHRTELSCKCILEAL